jgi:hypothetical protein
VVIHTCVPIRISDVEGTSGSTIVDSVHDDTMINAQMHSAENNFIIAPYARSSIERS